MRWCAVWVAVAWMAIAAQGGAAYYSPLDAPESVDDGVRALIAWAQENDIAQAGTMELYHFDGFGWGARALRRLEPDEVVIEVPPQYHIHQHRFRGLPFYNVTMELVAPSNEMQAYSARLAVFLLYDLSRDEPRYETYYRACPRTFGIPIEWGDADLALAKRVLAPDQFHYVQRTRATFTRTYERFQKHVLQNETFAAHFHPAVSDARHFQWALSVVSTRAWMLTGGDELRTVLVPVADMINHGCAAPMPRVAEDGLRLTSGARGYARGEQIVQDYGRKTSFQLMAHYGFVDTGAMLPSGPCEKVSTTLRLNGTVARVVRDVLEGAASELKLTESGEDGGGSVRVHFVWEQLSPCVLALLRTLLATSPRVRGEGVESATALPVACGDVRGLMDVLGAARDAWTLRRELDMLRYIHQHVATLAKLPVAEWRVLGEEVGDEPQAASRAVWQLLAAWHHNMRVFLARQLDMTRGLWRNALLADTGMWCDGDEDEVDVHVGIWSEPRVRAVHGDAPRDHVPPVAMPTVKGTLPWRVASPRERRGGPYTIASHAVAHDIARIHSQHYHEVMWNLDHGEVRAKCAQS